MGSVSDPVSDPEETYGSRFRGQTLLRKFTYDFFIWRKSLVDFVKTPYLLKMKNQISIQYIESDSRVI